MGSNYCKILKIGLFLLKILRGVIDKNGVTHCGSMAALLPFASKIA
jgi:hypothetical protein